ncbi:MAG: S8 family serine peptidase [Candidatus Sericytochromatia bacterium]|nr:S8 family serine peptidase [Candidatus Tanganyikabacteria bacterium]
MMPRVVVAFALASLLAACGLLAPLPAPAPPASGAYEPGELLVEFKEGTTPARVHEVHKAVGATPLEEIVPGIWRSGVTAGKEAQTIPRFLAFPEVRFAEFNGRLHPNMWGAFRPARLPDRTAQLKPTDPRVFKDNPGLPAQWALRRIDLCKAESGECAAWDTYRGKGVRVAVIDTGVDFDHPDLKGNLLTGANFLEGKGLPADDFGHGTHVAGIIAAVANNGKGIAGVAPEAQILPIRVLGVDGGNTAGLIQGLAFAIRNGAKVVNLSLGSAQTSEIEARQMAQAIANDVVVVAAAGNEALAGNPLEYPAAISGVISVAATRPATDDVEVRFWEHAPFSNYNPFVTVAAPGVDILSTIPRRYFATTGNPDDDGNAYAYASGTSMSAPVVSGLVALMLSAGIKPQEVRSRLVSGSQDIGDPGFDDYYGWGMINVRGALGTSP